MIAVASGKGGVGKSTVAANLAVALARAAAFLTRASASMCLRSSVLPEMGKFSTARAALGPAPRQRRGPGGSSSWPG